MAPFAAGRRLPGGAARHRRREERLKRGAERRAKRRERQHRDGESSPQTCLRFYVFRSGTFKSESRYAGIVWENILAGGSWRRERARRRERRLHR